MIKLSNKYIIGYFLIKNGLRYLSYSRIIINLIILIIIILFSYLSYIKLYINPKNDKALKEFFYAKKFFLKKKYIEALGNINSNKGYLGFIGISDKYFLTKTGNISNYYAGICFYKLKNYNKSIDYLRDFVTNEEILTSIKYGIIGDAFEKLKDQERALKYYIIASNIEKNNFNDPFFLYKTAILCYSMKKFKFSYKYFTELMSNYPDFFISKDLDKYLTISRYKMIEEFNDENNKYF